MFEESNNNNKIQKFHVMNQPHEVDPVFYEYFGKESNIGDLQKKLDSLIKLQLSSDLESRKMYYSDHRNRIKIIQINEFGSIIIALHDKYQSLILNKSIKKCDDLYYESINKLKITYITPIALGFLKNFTWNSGKWDSPRKRFNRRKSLFLLQKRFPEKLVFNSIDIIKLIALFL